MVEDNMYFATPKTMEWIEKLKQESKKNGTVGCVVLDKQGNLTAGTSTGGMFENVGGRIGDSPVIEGGTYADNNSCAVSCTGHGEYFIRHAVAFDMCARYKYLKESVEKAADYIIHTELNTNAGNGGLIAVDKLGNIAMPYNSGGMFRGFLYMRKVARKLRRAAVSEKKIVVVGGKVVFVSLRQIQDRMAKTKTVYVCSNCGADSPKWLGKCPNCGSGTLM